MLRDTAVLAPLVCLLRLVGVPGVRAFAVVVAVPKLELSALRPGRVRGDDDSTGAALLEDGAETHVDWY